MHSAARYGHPKAITTLAKRRSSLVNCKRNDGATPLHIAAGVAKDHDDAGGALRELIALGAQVNEQDDNGDTALHYACEANNVETIAVLIEEAKKQLEPTCPEGEKQLLIDFIITMNKQGEAAVDMRGLVNGEAIQMLCESTNRRIHLQTHPPPR